MSTVQDEPASTADTDSWLALPQLSHVIQFVLIVVLVVGAVQKDIFVLLTAIGHALIGIWIELCSSQKIIYHL